MRLVFLASVCLGALLAVYIMLQGVDRRSARTPFHVPVEPSARLPLPLLAAFLTCFGVAGYLVLLLRTAALAPATVLVAAAVAGVAGVVSTVAIINRWALPSAREEPEDERFLLQGHPAQVTAAIGTDGTGEIVFDVDGTRHASKARSVDGASVPSGTDVVIERVEDGVAYVEPWSIVEERI